MCDAISYLMLRFWGALVHTEQNAKEEEEDGRWRHFVWLHSAHEEQVSIGLAASFAKEIDVSFINTVDTEYRWNLPGICVCVSQMSA